MTKIAGSGSISQRHGSVDPDPRQNVTDPEHCLKHNSKAFVNLEVSEGARESGQLCSAVQQVYRQEESVTNVGLPTSKYKQNITLIP
jgi:hypothetical protein